MKINLEDVKPGLPYRLALFLNEKGINQRQFAIKTGLSNGLINQFFRKGTNLGSDKVLKILSTFPDFNANWWFREEGQMITEAALKEIKYKEAALKSGLDWEAYKERLMAVEEEVQKLKAVDLKV